MSPTTSPGSSPPGSVGSTRAAEDASPARTRPAARCTRLGCPTGDGGPRADRTATTVSWADRRRHPGRTPYDLARQVRLPPLGRREQQDWVVRSCRSTRPPSTASTVASTTIRGAPTPDTRWGLPSSQDDEPRHRTGLGQGRQRGRGAALGTDGGRRRGDGERDQNGGGSPSQRRRQPRGQQRSDEPGREAHHDEGPRPQRGGDQRADPDARRDRDQPQVQPPDPPTSQPGRPVAAGRPLERTHTVTEPASRA